MNCDALIGRKTTAGGLIVACFVDRGDLRLMVENPDGMLFECLADGIRLVNNSPLPAHLKES